MQFLTEKSKYLTNFERINFELNIKILLRNIRKNQLVNKLVWLILIKPLKRLSRFYFFLIRKWSSSGVVNCTFNQYKFKLYNRCDDNIVKYFSSDILYTEKADLLLFTELAKKSKTIVDIGANTGIFSVLSAKANPLAEIFAIEPYYINAQRLEVNIQLNLAKNVTISKIAMGEYDGEIQLSIPKKRNIIDTASMDKEFSQAMYPGLLWDSNTVNVITLDSYSREKKLKINLIKCDVETFEMSVFKGASKILQEDKPTILFESFLSDEGINFFNDILATNNYYLYLIFEHGVVYSPEGFTKTNFGLNYLISPVKPDRTFINYNDSRILCEKLLLNIHQF